MISRLRRRHLRMVGFLALAAPAILVAGVAAKRPQSPVQALEALPPAIFAPGVDTASTLVGEHPMLWGDLPIVTRLWSATESAEPDTVELQPQVDLRKPDLLVYWMDPTLPVDSFPESARLLGRLSGSEARRFALPAPQGSLVLYSLGHQERIGSAALPGSPHAAGSANATSGLGATAWR